MLASGKHCIVMADPGTEMYEFLQCVAILLPLGDIDACVEAIQRLRERSVNIDEDRRRNCLRQLDANTNLLRFLACTCANRGSI